MISFRTLKWLAVLIPPIIIGGFEFIRHDLLIHYLPMGTGNYYITLIALVVSYLFASWMFRIILRINTRLSEEQTARAIYEERERLARELHDDIAQILFFLNVQLKKGDLVEANSAVAELDNHLRQAIFNLRSLPNERFTFINRIQSWLKNWSSISGIQVSVSIHIPDSYYSTSEELQLFGIIQEAFTNIRKHSRAQTAGFTLETAEFDEDEWFLTIHDHGCGMNENVNPTNQYGLSMMRKRALELNSQMDITSSETGGTQIKVAGRKGQKH